MTEYTPNFNLKKPAPEDFYNIQDFNDNMDKLDAGAVKKGSGIAELSAGTLAARPAAGIAGRYYFAQDTGEIYFDTGTEWVLAAASSAELAAHLAEDASQGGNPHGIIYEEGVWAPDLRYYGSELVGVVYKTRLGRYIIDGGKIYVNGFIELENTDELAPNLSNIGIGSFPAGISSQNGLDLTLNFYWENITKPPEQESWSLSCERRSPGIVHLMNLGGSAGKSYLKSNQLKSNTLIRFSGTYIYD